MDAFRDNANFVFGTANLRACFKIPWESSRNLKTGSQVISLLPFSEAIPDNPWAIPLVKSLDSCRSDSQVGSDLDWAPGPSELRSMKNMLIALCAAATLTLVGCSNEQKDAIEQNKDLTQDRLDQRKKAVDNAAEADRARANAQNQSEKARIDAREEAAKAQIDAEKKKVEAEAEAKKAQVDAEKKVDDANK